MVEWMLTNCARNYQFLLEAATELTRAQSQLLAAQSRVGITLWMAMMGECPPVAAPGEDKSKGTEVGGGSAPGSLEQEAIDRIKKGLAPPREIYDVQNRGRIDWTALPDWARPIDPEVFEGAHEG
jgi:hypothetical protein